jgi:ribA/ribD-fused uncharacterized protein
MNMPITVEQLQQACAAGDSFDYLYFWGHSRAAGAPVGKSCLSQWYPSAFTLAGICYATAEHYMMAGKARLFDDAEALQRILAACSPNEVKAIGREIRGFDEALWRESRQAIVFEGNLGKFSQNPELARYLLGTAPRVLVEASPVDPVWGIGLAEGDSNAHAPATWRGLNLLGFALMQVRECLLSEPGRLEREA